MSIPESLFTLVGFLLISNLGVIFAALKFAVKRETEIALIQNKLEVIMSQLSDIKAFQDRASKEIHEAHLGIRELKVLKMK